MKAHKEINKIENILSILAEKLEVLESKIASREENYNDRSEKWQEGKKGIEYEEETQRLDDLHSQIAEKIEIINCELEELRELTE